MAGEMFVLKKKRNEIKKVQRGEKQSFKTQQGLIRHLNENSARPTKILNSFLIPFTSPLLLVLFFLSSLQLQLAGSILIKRQEIQSWDQPQIKQVSMVLTSIKQKQFTLALKSLVSNVHKRNSNLGFFFLFAPYS